MQESMRRTGIDVIGDVPWGTHVCQFYGNKQDLLDILVPYFRQGLADNEFCMWMTSEPLKAAEAKAALRSVDPALDEYLRKGQMEVLDYTEWYTPTGQFDGDEVLKGWVEKQEEALVRGYEGLRLTGNTFWLEKRDWADFTAYEEAVNRVIGQYRMLAVCTYSLDKCGAPEIIDVVSNHRSALIKRAGRWRAIETSERARAEEALHESHERYRGLFDSMTEGFALHEIVTDEQGRPVDYRFLDLNPAFERLTGLQRADLVGKRVLEALPGTESYWIENYGHVALTGEPAHFENHSAALGRWYEVYAYRPAFRQFAVVFTDVTARKQAEAEREQLLGAVQAERDWISALVASMRDEVWFADTQKRFTLANPAALEQFGLAKDAAVDVEKFAASLEVLREDGSPRPIEESPPLRALKGEVVINQEEIIRTPATGEPRYRQVNATPVRDKAGQIIGSVSVVRDVTDSKTAEAALRQSQQDLVRAQKVGQIGSWRLDTQRNVLTWSPENHRIFGVPEGTPMSYEFFLSTVHPDDSQYVDAKWNAGLRGEPYDIEHRILADGKVKWVREKAYLEFDGDGKLQGGFGITQDITARKEAEQALVEACEQAEWLARFPRENPWPVVRATTDGRVLHANPAAAESALWTRENGALLVEPLRALLKEAVEAKAPIERDVEMGDEIYSVAVALFPREDYANLYGRSVTERKRAERREQEALALAAASQTAVDILDAMGEGVLLLDMNGRITSVNPALENMAGIAAGELIGRPLRDMLPELLSPEDRALAEEALRAAMGGSVPEMQPMTLLSRTGRRIPLIPSVTFVRGPGNRPTEIVTTLRDISELRAAQESLEMSNALLERIFDNTHMSIVYLDRDFNFVRVNRAYADACQHPPEFFPGKNHFGLYPHAENEAIFRRVVETGDPFEIHEKPFEFSDHPEWGVTYWDWTLRPLRGERGRVEGLVFCLLDRTDRVRARQNLVESERKYRELVENANSIIMRITPEHNITFFNEYAQTFFGYTADEVLGKNVVGTIVPPVDSEGRDLRRMVREVTAQPEAHGSNEDENMCKDGCRVWVHWANRAVRDDKGQVKEILCVGTDITARKRIEKEAAVYRERLRELADRLALTEERERRRVSTQIHDTVIQTLSLSNIRLGGVRNAAESAGLAEHCEKVDQVRQLLDTGITECRGLMADLTPPLLYDLGLGPALREFARKQQEFHGIRIEMEEDDHPKPLDEARRGLMFQAARELVMNALKHAHPEAILISLSRRDEEVCLQVRDTGRGFDPASLDGHIADFEKGGFGLFNIRERLVGLDGHFDLDSAPGKGTTVTVRMPMAIGR